MDQKDNNDRLSVHTLSNRATLSIARPASSLGPIIQMMHVDSPFWGRVYAAGVAAAVVTVAIVAARLQPNDKQLGTHRQLGLPPCGFILVTGYPCPTCGMTTAFTCVAHGRFLAALRAQLAGTLLAVGTALTGLGALCCVLTGRYPMINWYRIDAARLVWAGCLIVLLAWGLKIVIGLAEGSLPATLPSLMLDPSR